MSRRARRRTLVLAVRYHGRLGLGWQRQPGRETIQGHLEQALSRIDGREVIVRGAARTDRGVHARFQVAAAQVRADVSPRKWLRALVGLLPREIAVFWGAWAPEGFRPRNDCGPKRYRYRFRFSPVPDPHLDEHAWWVPEPTDLEALPSLAASWKGRHDFAAACSTRYDGKGGTIRTLLESRFWTEGRLGIFEVAGPGFLTHQVRILAGTLWAVARGQRTPEEVAAALEARDRSRMGPTAPAHGLTLEEILLPELAWSEPWPTPEPDPSL